MEESWEAGCEIVKQPAQICGELTVWGRQDPEISSRNLMESFHLETELS